MRKPHCDSNSSFLSHMLSKTDTRLKGRHCIYIGDLTMVTIVPYGEYTFVIEATGIKDGEELKAEATGSILVTPPIPELTLIDFDKKVTLNLIDDTGKKIDSTYYEKKGDEVIENPVGVALASLETSTLPTALLSKYSPAATETTVYKELRTTLRFECPVGEYYEPTKWKVEIIDPETGVTLNIKEGDQEIPFEAHQKKVLAFIALVFDKVREIPTIKVRYYWDKHPDKVWKEVNTSQFLHMPLRWPSYPPFDQEDDARINNGFLGIACHLAEFVPFTSDSAANEENVRRKIVKNLHTWFKEKEFRYHGARPHTVTDAEGNFLFGYAGFMRPKYGPNPAGAYFEGECTDTACFFTLCCRAHGVDMKLNRLRTSIIIDDVDNNIKHKNYKTYPIMTCAFKEYAKEDGVWDYRDPTYREWEMPFHEVGYLNSSVWDPLYYFQISPWEGNIAAAASDVDYKINLAQPMQLPPLEYPYWDDDVFLNDVVFPDKHLWWPSH